MLKLNDLKVVLFDWDETLADNRKPRIDAINRVLKEFGMPDWSSTRQLTDRNVSFMDNIYHIFGLNGEEAYHKFRNYYIDKMKTESKLFDGVLEVLNFLKNRNIKIGVMTNKDRKLFDLEMPLLINPDCFDKVVCGHEAPNDKPSPDHALYTLKGLIAQTDINPDTVWVVGDSILDSKCAAAINALPLRVNYKDDDDAERLQGVEVYYYSTFKEFADDVVNSNQ